jgi:hypothetical protein
MAWLSGFGRRWIAPLNIVAVAAVGVATQGACYNTGDGEEPPLDRFYFPVGLQVSNGGSVLYAVNSDFDLQYNGGTLQSYDLRLIRRHALDIIADPRNPNVPVVRRSTASENPCPGAPPTFKEDGTGGVQPLGETCAPPTIASFYVRDTVVIGAFATDLQRSRKPSELIPQIPRTTGESLKVGNRRFDRLFMPVRGNATLTWISIERDDPNAVPPEDRSIGYGPFRLDCGRDSSNRCDLAHQAGEDPFEAGNTRNITMPGEPFGMAMSEDGEAIVITHQNETKTSLFSTGLTRSQDDPAGATGDAHPVPALQFVLEGMPFGGVGVQPVPHDRDAFFGAPALPRPAFFQTSRAIPEVSLIRQYPDEFGGTASSLRRPFLNLETAFPITATAGGTDSRGLAIDPTPRLACKAKVAPADPTKARTQGDVDLDLQRCGRLPARAFIANRSPASLLVGEIGIAEGRDGAYDADRLVIHSSIPLSAGPSKVYLAPIVDRDGAYALRVFAVCFDSATIFVIDPDTGLLENVIRTGIGPFAMAFDPFSFEDVAKHVQVPFDAREPGRGLRRYRFAYVASFTNSFVQLIDLDDAQPNRATFERIVFTLGEPTPPKGT